jgi:hypothetical protein
VVVIWLLSGSWSKLVSVRSRGFADFRIRGSMWLIGAGPSEARLVYVETG